MAAEPIMFAEPIMVAGTAALAEALALAGAAAIAAADPSIAVVAGGWVVSKRIRPMISMRRSSNRPASAEVSANSAAEGWPRSSVHDQHTVALNTAKHAGQCSVVWRSKTVRGNERRPAYFMNEGVSFDISRRAPGALCPQASANVRRALVPCKHWWTTRIRGSEPTRRSLVGDDYFPLAE